MPTTEISLDKMPTKGGPVGILSGWHFVHTPILLRWRRYLTLSSLSSWDGWQQVGVWCGVWQDYHKHAARPPIGFQPIKPSFFSSSTIFPFLLPTARSICLLFSSLAFNRSEMIWAQMLDKWSDYRKIEARTVYIALFPIHRIQISATYKKTLEMCLSFQNKKTKTDQRWLIQMYMEREN